MIQSRDNQPAAHETDPRFPRGEWTGHFIQQGRRHQMTVVLTFRDGRFDGAGIDAVGIFNIAGSYNVECGEVTAIKRYHGKHRVEYRGWAEAVGRGIWGTWKIANFDRGGFHIWPRQFGRAGSNREKNEQTAPAPEEDVYVPADTPSLTDAATVKG